METLEAKKIDNCFTVLTDECTSQEGEREARCIRRRLGGSNNKSSSCAFASVLQYQNGTIFNRSKHADKYNGTQSPGNHCFHDER